MKLYIPDHVNELQKFYGSLLYDLDAFPTIISHLAALAQRMLEGVRKNAPCIIQEISNYHKDYLGKISKIDNRSFSLNDCHQTIANEYGYSDWTEVEQLAKVKYNLKFERAVTLLLEGELSALEKLISAQPELLSTRSNYGHKATLLHYTASNGVEMWRQQVPYNLPAISNILIESGAIKGATIPVYNGEFTTYELLVTSIHPLQAGIMEQMKDLLKVDNN